MTLPENADVWVLAGQSNMQGCGVLENTLAPDERIRCFSSAGEWELGEEPLHRLWESFTPVHQAFMRPSLTEAERHLSDAEIAENARQNCQTGAGLGISFGQTMTEATGRPIGLIPAAHGGTSLEQWSQNLKNQGGYSLYGGMLERIQKASGNLRGVLWYQGESDATAALAATYAKRFDAWIAALRSDLAMPELPVIAVQIGCVAQNPAVTDGWSARSWEQVREALATLPDRVAHTAVTSAVDLGLDDTIHISTPELIRLGRRLARLALHLIEGEYSAAPYVERIEAVTEARGLGMARVVCSHVEESWTPHNHIAGFTLCTATGEPHPQNQVLNVRRDQDDPTSLRVLLNQPPDDNCYLGYGLGLNPYCNAVDAADMPLPAFLPRPVAL